MLKVDMLRNLLELNEDERKLLEQYFQTKLIIKAREGTIKFYKEKLKRLEESLVFAIMERESDNEE